MKIYRADATQSVNAIKRKNLHVPIPVFNFLGDLTISESDKWYPPTPFIFKTGYATASAAGVATAALELWKKTYHQQGDGIDIIDEVLLATATLSAGGVKAIFTSDVSINNAIVTPRDYITIKSLYDSGHNGVTVQIFGDKP